MFDEILAAGKLVAAGAEAANGHGLVLTARAENHLYGVTDLDAYTWFMTDVEWSWMSGRTPIEDW